MFFPAIVRTVESDFVYFMITCIEYLVYPIFRSRNREDIELMPLCFVSTEIVTVEESKKGFDFLALLHMLMDKDLPNLPPGGGLPAK